MIRVNALFLVGCLLSCACNASKATGQADAQVSSSMQGGASGSFASGGSSGVATGTSGASAASGGSADSGCAPAPASSPPRVLSGELAAVMSRCGANGAGPPLVGPEPPTTRIGLAIGFISPKADELDMFAREVSDPNSPLYRHYLTEEQLTALFGPSVCNYQSVVDWLKAAGIQVVMTYSDRFLIDAVATVAQIEATFHVTMNEYRRPDGTMFFAPDRDPSVTVGAAITIDGLDNCFVPTAAIGLNRDAGARD